MWPHDGIKGIKRDGRQGNGVPVVCGERNLAGLFQSSSHSAQNQVPNVRQIWPRLCLHTEQHRLQLQGKLIYVTL